MAKNYGESLIVVSVLLTILSSPKVAVILFATCSLSASPANIVVVLVR
jgi:hypothetical protein